MPFTYDTPVDPYSGSIAELLAHRGTIAANEAIAKANAWGSAIRDIGQTTAQTISSLADPKRQLAAIDLTNAKRGQAAQQAVASAMTPFTPQGPQEEGQPAPAPSNPYLKQEGDVSVWDVEGLSKVLASKGLGDLAPSALKGIEDLNTAHRQEASARATLAQAQTNVIAKGAGTALAVLRAHPDVDPRVVVELIGQQMEANQTFPPEKIAATKQGLLSDPTQLAAKLEGLSKLGTQAPVLLKEGEKALNPDDLSGPPLATNPKEPTNEAEIALKAAGGDPAKALDRLLAQKNPPSPEEQYLTAKMTGNTARASAILGAMQDVANAKRDPTLTALTETLRGLSVDTAKARLEELQRKNAPLDISGSVNTTMNGRQYIDISEWQTPEDRAKAQQAAVAQGIAPVNKDTAGMLSDLDTARQNQQTMMSLIESKLPKDAAGRLLKGPTNSIEKLLQSDPDLASIGTFRNAAIQSMRAVAGSKGLRINQAEVQLAIDNDIPKLSDTLDTARQKLANLSAFMDNIEKAHLVRDRSAVTGTNAKPPAASAIVPDVLKGLEAR